MSVCLFLYSLTLQKQLNLLDLAGNSIFISNLGESPIPSTKAAVAHDENIDESVDHTVEEAELGHVVKVLAERLGSCYNIS